MILKFKNRNKRFKISKQKLKEEIKLSQQKASFDHYHYVCEQRMRYMYDDPIQFMYWDNIKAKMELEEW